MNERRHTSRTSRARMRDAGKTASDGAKAAARSPAAKVVARSGFVFVGGLHLLLAWLAVQISLGGSAQADQSGAVEQLAGFPGGTVLLWGGAACCAALGAWMVVEAVGAWRRERRRGTSLGCAGTAAAYLGLAGLFGSFAIGARKNSSDQSRELTATLLAQPFGAVVLDAAGLALLGVGAYFAYRGVTRSFLGRDTQPDRNAPAAVTVLGCAGFTAKGIVLAAVGILVIVATSRHDPGAQTGLDGALKGLAAQPFGGWILGAVALGLACYGAYSAARAKYADF